ncbi:SDR family oxidoreductase [Bacillus carboniphilus]|uniref:SDR family oxidoreductase n=1 Tax=Bacillus carboniphilus TaxID=86663 RepID=A0ABY9JXF4_9BACI|nr:SDR family oxidoreductase [Bacillus carboniphilus]WLR43484.1 SDR family oxidoreductase [Bacillus carboniphilus]
MKTALVTGASGGIGLEIVQKLLADGYIVFAHYFANARPLEQLKDECLFPIQSDLSTIEGVSQLVKSIGHVDALVLNSGTDLIGMIQDVSEQKLDHLIHLHLKSPFMLVKKLIPSMIQNKKGSIVVTSSIWGQTGAALEVAYSMVKGGQISFVKALAKELAMSNIRVNAIAPGAIQTKMMDVYSKEELETIEEEIPMGRLGDAKEVASAVSYLLSDEASYITGQVLSVNGGWYC